jgi:hypothetical protein
MKPRTSPAAVAAVAVVAAADTVVVKTSVVLARVGSMPTRVRCDAPT